MYHHYNSIEEYFENNPSEKEYEHYYQMRNHIMAKNKDELNLYIKVHKITQFYDLITLTTEPNILRILLKHNADINAIDFQGNTLLNLIVQGVYIVDRIKQIEMIKLLLRRGANRNIKNNIGYGPIENATSDQLKCLFPIL